MANQSFAANIQKFADKTGLKVITIMKKLAFDGLRGVMLKSPVDTGRFRANWRVGLNRVVKTTSDKFITKEKGKPAPSGSVDQGSLASGNSVLATMKWTDTIYITNNVPYAGALERGHSKQAPHGVLAVTFAELKAGLETAVKSVGG